MIPNPANDVKTLENWLQLSTEPSIGIITKQQLLEVFGNPCAIYQASFAELRALCGSQKAQALLKPIEDSRHRYIQEALAWSLSDHCHIIHPGHPNYPESLLQLPQPPITLYLQGHLSYLNDPIIAIVGTRSASLAGLKIASYFADSLSQKGWNVISGLAAGIDRSAHLGALKNAGSTTAVLGSGIGHVYPTSNTKLYQQIATEGLLVSEFPLNSSARTFHFPLRNRIVAALSKAIIVIEASIKSGSLITAKIGIELGKEVFATPGSIDSEFHRGCHLLIKEGAHLLESPNDIHQVLGISSISPAHPTANLDPLLNELTLTPTPLDPHYLSEKTKLSIEQVQLKLFEFEMQGILSRTEDGRIYRSPLPS